MFEETEAFLRGGSGTGSGPRPRSTFFPETEAFLEPDAPAPVPEESFISRAAKGLYNAGAEGLGAVGHAFGTPARWLGTIATAAQEQMMDPGSDIGAMPGSRLRVTPEGEASGVDLSTLGREGLRAASALAGGGYDAGKGTEAAIGGDDPQTRRNWARAHPVAAGTEAIADKVLGAGLGFATDPSLLAFGPLGEAAKAGKLTEMGLAPAIGEGIEAAGPAAGILPDASMAAAAQKATLLGTAANVTKRGLEASFLPGMVQGAYEGVRGYREQGKEHGYFSPEALGQGASGVIDAAMAAMVGGGFVGPHVTGAERRGIDASRTLDADAAGRERFGPGAGFEGPVPEPGIAQAANAQRQTEETASIATEQIDRAMHDLTTPPDVWTGTTGEPLSPGVTRTPQEVMADRMQQEGLVDREGMWPGNERPLPGTDAALPPAQLEPLFNEGETQPPIEMPPLEGIAAAAAERRRTPREAPQEPPIELPGLGEPPAAPAFTEDAAAAARARLKAKLAGQTPPSSSSTGADASTTPPLPPTSPHPDDAELARLDATIERLKAETPPPDTATNFVDPSDRARHALNLEQAVKKRTALQHDIELRRIAESSGREHFSGNDPNSKSWPEFPDADDPLANSGRDFGHATNGRRLAQVVLDGDGTWEVTGAAGANGIFVTRGHPGLSGQRVTSGLAPLVFSESALAERGIRPNSDTVQVGGRTIPSEPRLVGKIPLDTLTPGAKRRAVDVIFNELDHQKRPITPEIIEKVAKNLGLTVEEVRARVNPARDARVARAGPPPPPRLEPTSGAPHPAPSPAQQESGNYEKGHLRWHGLQVSVETAKGGERVAKDGSWRVPDYPADYGYIRKTEGADGDHVDVFMGDHPAASHVYVIDQIDPDTGKFDEHKSMVGFGSEKEALDTYHRAYTDGRTHERIGAVTTMTPDEFKEWVQHGDTKKALSYKRKPSELAAEAKGVQAPPARAEGYPRGGRTETPAGAADRRQVQAPVTAERRKADRRTELAKKHNLPEEHPAIEEVIGAEEKARTDPLTGLGNKVHWTELQKSVDREKDHVGVLDLKKFKPINDKLGHDAGDTILKHVADMIRKHFGEDAARFGGDEFGIVFRGISLEEARAKGEAFRKDLASHTIPLTNNATGEHVDFPGVEAHLGIGRNASEADAAANLEAAPSRLGGRGAGHPDQPEPAPAAREVPERGVDGGSAPESPAKPEGGTGRETEGARQPVAPTEKPAWTLESRVANGRELWRVKRPDGSFVPDFHDTKEAAETARAEYEKHFPEGLPKKPVTPQVAEVPGGGTKYTLPGFVTEPFKKPAERTEGDRKRAEAEKARREAEDAHARARDTLQKEYKGLKTALTRALNTKDPAKILAEAERGLKRFEDLGTSPDDWSRWERAKEDAESALKRAGDKGWRGIPEPAAEKPAEKAPTEITVSFAEKPSKEVRDRLKGGGFRWSSSRGVWSAKPSDISRGVAEVMRINKGGKVTGLQEPTGFQAPELPRAFDLGKEAFAAGRRRIAPTDLVVRGQADSWYQGWDRANLDAPVPERPTVVDKPPPGGWRPEDKVPPKLVEPTPGMRAAADELTGKGGMPEGFKIEEPLSGKTIKEGPKVSANTIFTEDAANAARARLRSKLGSQISVGLDPEMLQDGITLAGYHVEKGARTFAAFSKAMVEDLGEAIRPHLKSWYMALKYDPRSEGFAHEMDESFAPASTEGVPSKGEQPTRQGAEVRGPEPSDRPRGQDEGTLEGAPPRPVRPAEGGGEAGAGGGQRGETHGGRTPRAGSGQEADLGPGVGDGEGEVHPPAPRPPGQVPAVRPPSSRDRGVDYRISEQDQIGAGGVIGKARANIDAIRTVKAILKEGRLATPEEQQKLVKFVGWGALQNAFDFDRYDRNADKSWDAIRAELKEVLTPEEYQAARHSTLNAHYTSPDVIASIWDGLRRLGVPRGSSFLEPATGIGHFLGLQPESMLPAPRYGVELDPLSGAIAKLLYPNASISIKGYQETKLPKDHFDVVASNVPFGKVQIHDPAYRKSPKMLEAIHNYYFAKSLDQVRPGGIVSFITSHFTMDSIDPAVRKYIAERADLLGAIRLPNTAFKGNAGTEVTTDILFLRRRIKGEPNGGEAFQDLGKAGDLQHNEYFVNHPEMVLGEPSMKGKMYGGGGAEYTVEGKFDPEALRKAIARLPEDKFTPVERDIAPPIEQMPAPEGLKDYAYTIKDGKAFRRVGEQLEPVRLGEPRIRQLGAMVKVREAVQSLISAEVEGVEDPVVDRARKDLNRAYDAFVKAHGPISSKENRTLMKGDPDLPLLMALEDYDRKKDAATKAPIFTQRTISRYVSPTTAGSPEEALAISLGEHGKVDLTRMGALTGQTREELVDSLVAKDLVYQNPDGRGWESREEYLSGPVRKKLVTAELAAKGDPTYERNVEALKKVQPEDLPPSKIRARLGANWIEPEVIRRFALETMQLPEWAKDRVDVNYNRTASSWTVRGGHGLGGTRAVEDWGTPRKNFFDLLDDSLNLKEATVWETDDDGKRYVNPVETAAAKEKQEKVRAQFEKWVWSDPERSTSLVRTYNDLMNDSAPRRSNGDHLKFPGMARGTLTGNDLLTHQKDAVWRAITMPPGGGLLLNQAVGAGKTFEMAAIAMEFKRLGLAKKSLLVSPNHLVSDAAAQTLRLYPQAKLLILDKPDWAKDRRQQAMSRIATGDWDMVIVPMTSFKSLPVHSDTLKGFMQEELAELETAIADERAAKGETGGGKSRDPTIKQLEKMKANFLARLQKLTDTAKDEAINFEQLGVDNLMADEAQAYKKIQIPSRGRISGIATEGSQRAEDMLIKTRWLKRRGGRVVFATATPVTNTMGEVFVMQKFLQPEALEARGMSHFDAWRANFGETANAVELSIDGKTYKAKERFSRFVNVGDLASMFAESTHTNLAADLKLPVPLEKGGKPIVHISEPTKEQAAYIRLLVKRGEAVKSRGGPPMKGEDNMLVIGTDGRKAATDMRLIDKNFPDDPGSKINEAVATMADIYHRKLEVPKHTQLMFLDLSTPKEGQGEGEAEKAQRPKEETELDDDAAVTGEEGGFETAEEIAQATELYADMKKKLVAKGVPADEIAFIHQAKNREQMAELFSDMNSGRVRILMASSAKGSTGMNVQRLLYAIHHIDAPQRPDEMIQRDGRAFRQGNLSKEVERHRYLTKNSFDAFMWQQLERKQGFIDTFMKADPTVREIEDTGLVTLNAAEMKAAASGRSEVIEKVGNDGQIRKLEQLQTAYRDAQHRRNSEAQWEKQALAGNEKRVVALKAQIAETNKAVAEEGGKWGMTVGETKYADREAAGTALHEAVVAAEGADGKTVIGSRLGQPITLQFKARMTDKGIVKVPFAEVGDKPFALNPESAKGTIASLDHAIRTQDHTLAEYERFIDRGREKIGELEELQKQPFEYTDQLAAAKARDKELVKILSTEGGEEAPEAAARRAKELDEDRALSEWLKARKHRTPGDQFYQTSAIPPPMFDAAGIKIKRTMADVGADALQRLKDRAKDGKAFDLGSVAGEGAAVWRDATLYGASLIHQGIRKFADWSARMTQDLGDTIANLGKHLRNLFDQSGRRAAAGPPPEPPKPPTATAAPAAGPAPKAPAPPKVPISEALAKDAVTASNRAHKIADTFEATNRKLEIAMEGADRIQERGTIEKPLRPEFRGEGQPDREQTENFRFSEADIEKSGAELVAAVKEFKDFEKGYAESADPNSAQAMRVSRQIMEQAVKNWQVYRTSAGRAVQRFNRPIPRDVIDRLREAGLIAGNLRDVHARAPIASNILHGLQNWGTLSHPEKVRFAKDVVDHFRLNLFSVTSWTLDMIGNASELTGQAGAGLGHDLVRVVKGDPTFPSLQGAFRAIRANPAFRELSPDIEHALETTVGGERLRKEEGAGIFTYRKGIGSKIYDYGVGAPLYWKGFMDTAAKRMGALWTLNRDAIEAAREKGLQGADREDFIKGFLADPPPDALARALSNGKKAGFNRDLSKLEESVASSTTAKLLVDVFARWPFQFARWGAEMLGYNPEMYHKLRAGTLKAEDVGEYLGKAAVGVGGLMLLNNYYNRTDFNSMEYVDEDGNRVRLSNRDPIPTGLWLLAVLKGAYAAATGDKKARDEALAKATAALQFASVPGARLLAGQGGLLGGTIKVFLQALENPQNDPRALRRELEDTINRAIPGQALLSALKTAFDPTIREGIGANLPIVSHALPAAVNAATGEPLQPRQRVLGVELPAIGGTPIPGATRLLDPVQKLLSRFGLLVYRGPRAPIAGYPPGQVPEELRTEWQGLFGHFRNKLLGPLTRLAGLEHVDERQQESIRKKVQERDRAAAEMANREMRRRHGGPRKLPRQGTRRELAGPDVFQGEPRG